MFPEASILKRRPESRSVKRASPPGRKAIPHGTSRFVAMTLVSTSTGPVLAGSFSRAPVAGLSFSRAPAAGLSSRVVGCGVRFSGVVSALPDGRLPLAPQDSQNATKIRASARQVVVRFGKQLAAQVPDLRYGALDRGDREVGEPDGGCVAVLLRHRHEAAVQGTSVVDASVD